MALGARRRGHPLRGRARVRLLGLALPLPMLAGCKTHFSFLDPQGPIAAAQAWHFYWVLGIMAVLVAGPIFLLLPFFAWRYRYGAKSPRLLPRPRYTPKWESFLPLEIASWGGPILIVAVLAFFVWRDAHRLDPYRPLASAQPPLRVQVIGYDWKWLFIYPDQGVASVGVMAMPVGRPVAMRLTSATVMQSFFIPALGSQIYAMGGMVTQLHLEAARTGRFLGENTMYSGDGFHHEHFTAVAMSPDRFGAWVRRVKADGVPLNAAVYQALSRRGVREQLLAALPPSTHNDGDVYLKDVSASLFPAEVEATRNGTGISLAGPATEPPPSRAGPKSAAPPMGKTP